MEPSQGKMGNGLKVASFFNSNGSKVTPLLYTIILPTAGFMAGVRNDHNRRKDLHRTEGKYRHN